VIVLDTNVLSELTRRVPNERVATWIDTQVDLAITATTVGEIFAGIRRMSEGRRRAELAALLTAIIDEDFADRVLPYDRAAAEAYAIVMTTRLAAGRPIGLADAQIAAICLAIGAAIATRNVRDFEGTGVTVINPWDAELR
jgi:toxin FitB